MNNQQIKCNLINLKVTEIWPIVKCIFPIPSLLKTPQLLLATQKLVERLMLSKADNQNTGTHMLILNIYNKVYEKLYIHM